MPAAYRFLRFQIAGVAFFLYWMAFLSPFVSQQTAEVLLSDGGRLIAAVGLLFVFSMPIGYVIHQFAVNRKRSRVHRRSAHDLLESIIDRTNSELLPTDDKNKRFQVLDALLTYFSRTPADSPDPADDSIADELDGRWSHFYARIGLGFYSALPALVVALVTLGLSYFLRPDSPWQPVSLLVAGRFTAEPLSFVVLFLLVAIGAAIILGMNRYLAKLWTEINGIEYMLMLRRHQQVEDTLRNVENPEQVGNDLRRPSVWGETLLGRWLGRR